VKQLKKTQPSLGTKLKGNKLREKINDLTNTNSERLSREHGEKHDTDTEHEKKIKMLEELESSSSVAGEIEELDLTTDDWVNVHPTEITKRYEMLRRYVSDETYKLK
jgi:hypothetical protein